MPAKINTFVVLLLFGSLWFIAYILITNPLKVNRRANNFFGLSMILWSTYWLDELGKVLDITMPDHGWTLILFRFAQFFSPILFYLTVLNFTEPLRKFRKKDLLFLILPLIYLICLFAETYFPGSNGIPEIIQIVLILVQVLWYSILSYLKIREHQKKIETFSSETSGINLFWLEYIIILVLVISILVFLYNLIYYKVNLNLFMNSIFLMVIYAIGYFALRQKEIYPADEKVRQELVLINEEIVSPNKKKIISDSELISQKAALNKLMTEQLPYLDSELTLMKLAEISQLSTHQLSYIINSGFNDNFFGYINTYRIEKAKQLLRQTDSKYSILGIAFESGFNSKTTFNNTFKKITGITPSEFKENRSEL